MRNIRSVFVVFETITDDKDKSDSMTYTVFKGSTVVGSLSSIGGGVRWADNSTVGMEFPIDIAGRANEGDRPNMRVNVSKNGSDKGFRCRVVRFRVQLDDSSIEEWHTFDGPGEFRMGDGNSNSQDTSLAS